MYDVIIIGSGPAGLTSAIYSTRANLKTLVIAGATWGGQLMLTTLVENFPGFPEGIEGPELMLRMRKQAEKFGAEILEESFVSGDFRKSPFLVKTDGGVVEGKSVIIATGADTKWLGVTGERERIGRGVSSCAPCDGPFFRNKDIIVAGGGDSAMEEAIVLTKYAKSVTVVHRRSEFRASPIMVDKARASGKIGFLLNSQIVEIMGEQKVERVRFESTLPAGRQGIMNQESIKKKGGVVVKEEGETVVWEMPIEGVFVAIGHLPNSKVFQGIDVDEGGYIKVGDNYSTNIEGVFVAGDVHDSRYKQAITAAGFGCAVALETQWWLDSGKGA
jgi:thioredoxin reductase (NADPH)